VIRVIRHFQFRGPALAALLAPLLVGASDFHLSDRFGRALADRGVTLVDWDGQLANPAIEITVKPPADAGPFPTTATIAASGARIYFDLPSQISANGPTKVLTFASVTSAVPVRISIFPDRAGGDEDYALKVWLNSQLVTNTFPLHVVDEDMSRPAEFAVTVDFSHDRSGFFGDPRRRAIVEQAAADWAYFIGDMQLDAVPAGEESTFVWGANGAGHGVWATNRKPFRGFLFYASGVHGPELRSGGCASDVAFQRSGQSPLPLRRSGSCETETAGNYNTLGWLLTASDDDWWVSGNQEFEPNDFYSIAHHEVGHALFFSPAHTRFGEFKARGTLDAGAVTNYHGTALAVDHEDHFVQAVDRISGRGAFGSEYAGDMPVGRWLATKLDLLNAQALGYHVRETSALKPLTLHGGALPAACVAAGYAHRLAASGGVAVYDYTVIAGALPEGLTLDRFTGVITGTPSAAGVSQFVVRLRDADPATAEVTANFKLAVQPAETLASAPVHGGSIPQMPPPTHWSEPALVSREPPIFPTVPVNAVRPFYREWPK
jgi:hypothetical protein